MRVCELMSIALNEENYICLKIKMEAANCKEKTSNYPNILKICSGFCVWI